MKDDDVVVKFEQRFKTLQHDETICLVLCRRSGLVPGWEWDRKGRRPPLPFWEARSVPGQCRVCGQPIYAGGTWQGMEEPSKRLTWHRVCATAYLLWRTPADYASEIVVMQRGLCPDSGEAIGPPATKYIGDIDIDHRLPIYRVRRDHGDLPWFDLLRFWGLSNLCAITRAAHLRKSAIEAAERAGRNSSPDQLLLFR